MPLAWRRRAEVACRPSPSPARAVPVSCLLRPQFPPWSLPHSPQRYKEDVRRELAAVRALAAEAKAEAQRCAADAEVGSGCRR